MCAEFKHKKDFLATMPTTEFAQNLILRNQKNPRSIALPESDDIRVMTAALQLLEWSAVKKIHTVCTRSKIEQCISGASDLMSAWKKHAERFEFCSESEIGVDDADHPRRKLLLAGQLLKDHRTDSVLAGALYTTADVIRMALKTIGLAPGCKTISSSFLLVPRSDRPANWLMQRPILFGDPAVVVEPTLEQLKDIAGSCVETFSQIFPDTKPVVAFLSFSTHGSAQHAHAHRMAEAARLFKNTFPNIESDGELQLDAALDPVIAKRKGVSSNVAGNANIFIFPNLDAANISYKLMQRLAGFDAFGPILQGSAQIVCDLSRGASSFDIAIAALINGLRVKA